MFNFNTVDWHNKIVSFLMLFCIFFTLKDLFWDGSFIKSIEQWKPSSYFFVYYSVEPEHTETTEDGLPIVRLNDDRSFNMISDSQVKQSGFMSWQDILSCENEIRSKKFPPQEWPFNREFEGKNPSGRQKVTWGYYGELPQVNSVCRMCGTIFFETNLGNIKTHKYCTDTNFKLIVEDATGN